jgi:hypothetical protein
MSYNYEKWEKQLKPCPFCGRDYKMRDAYAPLYIAEVGKPAERLRVVCSCGASMDVTVKPIYNAADELVEKWNKREAENE